MPHPTERIANCLATTGWYVGESVFSEALTVDLARRARMLASMQKLRAARVGRHSGAQINGQLRNDDTLWIADSPDDPVEQQAVAAVHALRLQLNESLFIGAQNAELHFARYAPGAFYTTHRDRFRDDDARVVSLVFYLNHEWASDAGGELVLYADDGKQVITRVSPRAGTMACFLSDRFPHEVLPASCERFSLTGWLRRAA